jgi:hypothetical protein
MKLSYKKFTPSGLLMINENYVLIPEGLHIYRTLNVAGLFDPGWGRISCILICFYKYMTLPGSILMNQINILIPVEVHVFRKYHGCRFCDPGRGRISCALIRFYKYMTLSGSLMIIEILFSITIILPDILVQRMLYR